ncbi:hypothetical protein BIV_ORF35 [Bohle iridovirus]|uniref:Transmembrane protein n=2 Tax=Frog virus 3 TaxID=10493 RepID=A0A3S8V949_FRG3V|nr:hypothetical protein D1R28_gp035 [Bohle iridovirus]ANK57960.1 hypothetical protein BIV_ORF35 [Bohle iridovirus]AZM32599.1 hypothetical protein [Zoo ranavirus]
MSGIQLDKETILKYSSAVLVALSAVVAVMMVSNNSESWKPILVGAVVAASGAGAYQSWWPKQS